MHFNYNATYSGTELRRQLVSKRLRLCNVKHKRLDTVQTQARTERHQLESLVGCQEPGTCDDDLPTKPPELKPCSAGETARHHSRNHCEEGSIYGI